MVPPLIMGATSIWNISKPVQKKLLLGKVNLLCHLLLASPPYFKSLERMSRSYRAVVLFRFRSFDLLLAKVTDKSLITSW